MAWCCLWLAYNTVVLLLLNTDWNIPAELVCITCNDPSWWVDHDLGSLTPKQIETGQAGLQVGLALFGSIVAVLLNKLYSEDKDCKWFLSVGGKPNCLAS